MGKQVRVYMTGADETKFWRFAKSTGDVELLPYHMSSPSDRLTALPPPKSSRFWQVVYLYNPVAPDKLTIRRIGDRKDFLVDSLSSPVVQFRRTLAVDNRLVPGRLWAEFSWLDPAGPVHRRKSQEFADWFETIAGWIRKTYKRVAALTYAGAGAIGFAEKGGKLG